MTRSWSLPMSAPVKYLVFDLLLLDLERCGSKMKSMWKWTKPMFEGQEAVLECFYWGEEYWYGLDGTLGKLW